MNKSLISFFSDPSYGCCDSSIKVDGKPVSYGVVNEREVRAVAGLMFAIGLTTLLVSLLTKDITLATIVIPTFLLEFVLKVFWGPQASFFALLTKPLIAHLPAEWVGAIQKRFAWSLGAIFASIVFIVLVVLNIRGPLPFMLCSICLILMWLESAAGICLGCHMYSALVKKGYIKKLKDGPKCAGGVCEI